LKILVSVVLFRSGSFSNYWGQFTSGGFFIFAIPAGGGAAGIFARPRRLQLEPGIT
jgi:hypothetical protein